MLFYESDQVRGTKELITVYIVGVVLISALILFFLFFSSFPPAQAADKTECSGECTTIASVIAAEACGEGAHGMMLVSEVIANRARAWKKSPYQIVTARNQFYGFTAPNRQRLYNSCKPIAHKLALDLLAGNTGDNTNGSLYFLAPGEKKGKWIGKKMLAYKRHSFYREK